MHKNELKGESENINAPGRNGLRRGDHSPHEVVGAPQRRKLTINNRANDDIVHRDNKFQVGLLNAGLKQLGCKTEDEALVPAIPKMLAFLKTDRLEEDKEVDVSNRIRIIKKSSLFRGELKSQLIAAYEGQRQNPGNTESHHSSLDWFILLIWLILY